MKEHSPLIFLSYASPDRKRVIPFYTDLMKDGFNVWLDCEKLKPGQNWDFEVKRSFDKSSIIIVFISESSVSKRGYVQRELKIALDNLAEKLIDDIYIIPILLDNQLDIPEELKKIHCISASESNCLQKVKESLIYQLGKLGLDVQRNQSINEFAWTRYAISERWDGLPGYEAELQLINFTSEKFKSLHEISEYIKGDLLTSLFLARSVKLSQAPELYNYAQDEFKRTNTFDAYCAEPYLVGKVLSVQYSIHWYGAGAAHPNMHFKTYSFVVEPLFLIRSLKYIFENPQKSLTQIQSYIRKALAGKRIDSGESLEYDPEWVKSGTQEWHHFENFLPKDDGIEFLFDPYQITAYVFGPQSVFIPYSEIVHFMRKEYIHAFGIEHILYRK